MKWNQEMKKILKWYKKRNDFEFHELKECIEKMISNIIIDPFNLKYRNISSNSKKINKLFF